MFGTDQQSIRAVYLQAWRKYQTGETLNDVEKQVLVVLLDHKEYQTLMEQPDKAMAKQYSPALGETNPYLHMGLHLAIRDQVFLDKPQGIKVPYDALISKEEPHDVEHKMMTILAQYLWQCQQEDAPSFDEQQYVEHLKQLL